jgi:membrane associated rhomboid family serine protease
MLLPIKDYNPTRRTAYVTIVIIVINVVVFLYQNVMIPDQLRNRISPLSYHVIRSALVPREITHFKNFPIPVGQDGWGRTYYMERDISPFLTFLTSMFMHGSLWHLLGNMLFLWIFGNNIEDYLGRLKFIFFYLVCGLGASLAHILFHFNSLTPVIGASGAVSGVMGAYLILYPNARVRSLVFIFFFFTFVDIPAFIFLIVWFIFQFLNIGGQGIAWLAHVGGFLIGLLLIKWWHTRQNRRRPIIEILQ